MAKQLFTNGASALLAASINDTDLTIQVQTGFGALFPSPGTNEYFLVALENASGDREVVKVTSRATDLFTVPAGGRGQEGTAAAAWTNGLTRVELRVTKGTLENFIQRGGDAMSGDLDMAGHELQDARFTGDTVVVGGQLVGTAIRGTEDDTSNEIVVPNDGTRATASGNRIVTEADVAFIRGSSFVVGQIIFWYGAIIDIPSGWHLCDGTGGTPDLRDKFVIGAGNTYALNATGGSATASGSTDAAGDHSHGGVTGDTTLDASMIPSHTHSLFVNTTATSSDANGFGVGGDIPLAGDAGTGAMRTTNLGGRNLVGDSSGGAGGPHNHSISASGGHSHSFEIAALPPYKALFYIMYVG